MKRVISLSATVILLAAVFQCASYAGRDATGMATAEEGYYEKAAESDAMPAESARRSRSVTSSDEKPAPEAEQTRMMIYEASLKSLTEELDSAIARVTNIIKSNKGYIESQRIDKDPARAVFTLRVPVNQFDQTLRELSAIGRVTYRNITAKDITKEFSDLSQRLANRQQLLSRLYELLKRTKETKQKIRILNEIARLNKEIEAMKARKDYLAKKAAYSTIEFTLNATRKIAVNQGSAISWIRSLQPSKQSLSGTPQFDLAVPDGFLDSSDDFRSGNTDALYQSPDGVIIRTATIENNPKGSAAFYEEALLFERQRYPEEVQSHTRSGNRVELTTPQQVGYQKAWYTIVLFVEEEEIHAIEVYYPNEKSYKEQKNKVSSVIRSIKPRAGLSFLTDWF